MTINVKESWGITEAVVKISHLEGRRIHFRMLRTKQHLITEHTGYDAGWQEMLRAGSLYVQSNQMHRDALIPQRCTRFDKKEISNDI